MLTATPVSPRSPQRKPAASSRSDSNSTHWPFCSAADRRTKTDSDRIIAAASSLEPLGAASSVVALEAHRAFHVALYRASHNELLSSLLDGLWDKADRYRRAALETREDSPADRARVQQEHQDMMAAVLDGDPDAAEAHMHSHVVNSLGRRAIEILAG